MSDFFNTWLETLYVEGDKFTPLTSPKNLLSMVNFEKLEGARSVDRPFTLSASQNTAGTYENSKTKATNGLGGAAGNHFTWIVPLGELNHVVEVPNKDLAVSSTPQARANAMKLAVDQGSKQFGQDIAQRFGGVSGGSLGSGVYSTSGHVVTFDNPRDARHYSPGMLIEASEDDGTGGGDAILAQRASVVSVDVDAGTMVVGTASNDASAANPGGAWTNSIALFFWKAHTFVAASPTDQVLGISDVITETAATSTVANVNRGLDSRLLGVWLTSSEAGSLSIADRVISLCAKGEQIAGWLPGDRIAVFSPVAYAKMVQELTTLHRSVDKAEERYGYRGVWIETSIGAIMALADRTCPDSVFRVVDVSGITCHTPNGKMVDFARNPGGDISQMADDSNNHRVRLVFYNCTIWDNPSHHGVGPTGL